MFINRRKIQFMDRKPRGKGISTKFSSLIGVGLADAIHGCCTWKCYRQTVFFRDIIWLVDEKWGRIVYREITDGFADRLMKTPATSAAGIHKTREIKR